MPFCHKCGKRITEDTKFCPECGAPTLESRIAEVKPLKRVAPKSNIWLYIVLVVIVLVVILASTCTIFMPLLLPLGEYKAVGTKSYSGMVLVQQIYLEVDNLNGPIRVETWERAEYKIDLAIEARGTSQKNAEANLNELHIIFNEIVIQEQKRLILKYDIPFLAQSRYSIDANIFLPADTTIDLDLDSNNGGIYLTEIEGAILRMKTSNGPLVFDKIYSKRVTGVTSNGNIEGEIEAEYASLSTSNGKIEFVIPSTVSGEYNINTSNGEIKLTLSFPSQVGYNLDLSTSNAEISIALSDLIYTQNQRTHKEAHSKEFSDKVIQIIIQAYTSNGNINVNTS